MKIEVLSEFSYLIRFPGDKTSLPEPTRVGLAAQLIREAFDDQWAEVVPVFADLLVTLSARSFSAGQDPEAIIAGCLEKLERQDEVLVEPRLIEVPACYDEEFAEDLPEIAEQGGLSVDEAVRLHSEQTYKVYAMGFCAGFAYMGDVPDALKQPRRSSPRTKIPAGSVAIADFMTAVYPLAMPGGWHIIGRCPVPFFNPEDQDNPTLLRAGDLVRFQPVDKDEFYRLKEKWRN
jgi:inhibitor of KinA